MNDAATPTVHKHVQRMLGACEGLPRLPTAVVAPEEKNSLGGALLAAEHALIEPLLVGNEARIRAAADALGADLGGVEVVPAAHHDEAAHKAVELVSSGRAGALMKGHLHTDELLRVVLSRAAGLRGQRRVSHAFVLDVPGRAELLMVTDGAINIAPDFLAKIDIVQNAIDLGLALGLQPPRVAIVSAVEVVNPAIDSTLEAAGLAKMAERGEITGGLVDGPLAMDNALSLAAARTKGIESQVAGRANILAVPNIECGNMISKLLPIAANAEIAGVVLGVAVPIILTSRADGDSSRLASCAVAALFAHWQRSGTSALVPGGSATSR